MPRKVRKSRSSSSDSSIRQIEKTYNIDFGVRTDMKLSTYLKTKAGVPSLGEAVEKIAKTLDAK